MLLGVYNHLTPVRGCFPRREFNEYGAMEWLFCTQAAQSRRIELRLKSGSTAVPREESADQVGKLHFQ